jgi:hypothetical protein
MLRHVTLVRTDVSEELRASIIKVTRISQILVTLMMEVLSYSETSVLTRASRRNIPEDAILESIKPVSEKSCSRILILDDGQSPEPK